MSILIKGMEMPKGCAFCKISRRNSKKMICPFIWKCEWDIHDPMSVDHRLDGCPLIPVPDHGDLIDRDVLLKKTEDVWEMSARYSDGGFSRFLIECEPVVIPREGKEQDEF